jgi:hypothetical protein
MRLARAAPESVSRVRPASIDDGSVVAGRHRDDRLDPNERIEPCFGRYS